MNFGIAVNDGLKMCPEITVEMPAISEKEEQGDTDMDIVGFGSQDTLEQRLKIEKKAIDLIMC